MSYIAFVDEAGISNPAQEPFLVVAGVIVHADKKLIALKRHLDTLVARHIPVEHRQNFVFHAKEIFNGGGKVFKRSAKDDPNPEWPLERRLKIADDLAAIPAKFNLPLAFGSVERATFPITINPKPVLSPEEKVTFPHVTAFMTCAMQVEHWMRQNASGEICLMIIEDNERARKLIRDTQVYHQDPKLVAQLTHEDARKHFPFRKIMEDPSFQPKRPSSVLQVADFCAYVFKRHLMKDKDNRYDRFVNRFWDYLAAAPTEDFASKGKPG